MTIDMEIDTDAERARCPSCNAANVFLTHSVRNMDARRHVECRICSMRGPIKMSDVEAIGAWNDLPRRSALERTPMTNDAERVSDIVARLRAQKVIRLTDLNAVRAYLDDDSMLHHEAADIIEAQSKALAEARVVKPLSVEEYAWRDGIVTRKEPFCWRFVGLGLRWDCEFWGGTYTLKSPERKQMGDFETFDQAKDAAQADYQQRILSALLTPTPENPNG